MSNIDDIIQTLDALQGKLKQFKADIQFAKNMANPRDTQPPLVRKRAGRPPKNGPFPPELAAE